MPPKHRSETRGAEPCRALRRAAAYSGVENSDPGLEVVLKYLSCGLSNAINFVRPHRLVLVDCLTLWLSNLQLACGETHGDRHQHSVSGSVKELRAVSIPDRRLAASDRDLTF